MNQKERERSNLGVIIVELHCTLRKPTRNFMENYPTPKRNQLEKTSNVENVEQKGYSKSSLFIEEQLEHLYKLFTTKMLVTPSSFLSQKGISFSATLLSTKPNSKGPLIIDSKATNHMAACSKLFSTYNPCASHNKVKITYGTFSTIANVGSIPISKTLTLQNVLHVPNLSHNLLSISKLTQDLNCLAGRMIDSSKEINGLYLFEDEVGPKKKLYKNCLDSIFIHQDEEIMLWNYMLDHPNFIFFHLFPILFKNKNSNMFSCEVCQFAKHHRSSYSPKSYKQSNPFTLIHIDVSEPCQDPTLNGKR
ncbi:hypothetical protein CR513_43189, partial [Mucuna pruriens]